MRTVVAISRKVNRKSKDGKSYTLYTYILDDGEEIDSLQEFEIGEQVTTWYDEKYHKAKMRKKR